MDTQLEPLKLYHDFNNV